MPPSLLFLALISSIPPSAPLHFGVEFTSWPLAVCNVVPFSFSAAWTSPNGSLAPVDADNWPTGDAYAVLFDLAPTGYDPLHAIPKSVWGIYTVSFSGRGAIQLYPGCGTLLNATFDAATFTTLAYVSLAPPSTPGLVIGVFNAVRNAQNEPGFTNLRVLQPTCPPAAPPFLTPAAASALLPFAHIRVHEWEGTNTIPVAWPSTVAWGDRRQLGDVFWAAGSGGKPLAVGAPWESALLIAAQLGNATSLWVNVPVYATDEYVAALAALLRHGSAELGVPGLSCPFLYVEHGNELWLNESDSPKNYAYNLAAAAGEVAGGGSPLNNDGERSPPAWSRRRHAKRLREIATTFRAAFEGSATAVRPVFAWMQEYVEDAVGALQWLESTFGKGEAARAFWGFAVNGYRGPGLYPPSQAPLPDFATPADVLAALLAASDAAAPSRAAAGVAAASFGLQFLTYEGAGWALPNGAGFNGAGFNATVASIIAMNRGEGGSEQQAYDVLSAWPENLVSYNFYSLGSA